LLAPGPEFGVAGGSETLRFKEIVGAIAESGFGGGDGFYAGVEDGGRVVVESGAAGEATVGVWSLGSGSEGDGEVFPVEHVRADSVRPVHVAPDGGVGVVLEKHVVEAAEIDRSVGVVHPITRGKEMKLWAERIGGELGLRRKICERRKSC
jgi:hypothetical protein